MSILVERMGQPMPSSARESLEGQKSTWLGRTYRHVTRWSEAALCLPVEATRKVVGMGKALLYWSYPHNTAIAAGGAGMYTYFNRVGEAFGSTWINNLTRWWNGSVPPAWMDFVDYKWWLKDGYSWAKTNVVLIPLSTPTLNHWFAPALGAMACWVTIVAANLISAAINKGKGQAEDDLKKIKDSPEKNASEVEAGS